MPVVVLTPLVQPSGLGEPLASKPPGVTPEAVCWGGAALKPGTLVRPSTATTLPASAVGTNAGWVLAKYEPVSPLRLKPCRVVLNAFSTAAAEPVPVTSKLLGAALTLVNPWPCK